MSTNSFDRIATKLGERNGTRKAAPEPVTPVAAPERRRVTATTARAHARETIRLASRADMPTDFHPMGTGFFRRGHAVWELRAAEDALGGYVLTRRTEERAVDLREHPATIERERTATLRVGQRVAAVVRGQVMPAIVMSLDPMGGASVELRMQTGDTESVPSDLITDDDDGTCNHECCECASRGSMAPVVDEVESIDDSNATSEDSDGVDASNKLRTAPRSNESPSAHHYEADTRQHSRAAQQHSRNAGDQRIKDEVLAAVGELAQQVGASLDTNGVVVRPMTKATSPAYSITASLRFMSGLPSEVYERALHASRSLSTHTGLALSGMYVRVWIGKNSSPQFERPDLGYVDDLMAGMKGENKSFTLDLELTYSDSTISDVNDSRAVARESQSSPSFELHNARMATIIRAMNTRWVPSQSFRPEFADRLPARTVSPSDHQVYEVERTERSEGGASGGLVRLRSRTGDTVLVTPEELERNFQMTDYLDEPELPPGARTRLPPTHTPKSMPGESTNQWTAPQSSVPGAKPSSPAPVTVERTMNDAPRNRNRPVVSSKRSARI